MVFVCKFTTKRPRTRDREKMAPNFERAPFPNLAQKKRIAERKENGKECLGKGHEKAPVHNGGNDCIRSVAFSPDISRTPSLPSLVVGSLSEWVHFSTRGKHELDLAPRSLSFLLSLDRVPFLVPQLVAFQARGRRQRVREDRVKAENYSEFLSRPAFPVWRQRNALRELSRWHFETNGWLAKNSPLTSYPTDLDHVPLVSFIKLVSSPQQ